MRFTSKQWVARFQSRPSGEGGGRRVGTRADRFQSTPRVEGGKAQNPAKPTIKVSIHAPVWRGGKDLPYNAR
jgi:hypothetical protein